MSIEARVERPMIPGGRRESAHVRNPGERESSERRFGHDLIPRQRLQQLLGVIWCLDGLLQLQPTMFTRDLVTNVMQPAVQGQPSLVAASLRPLITLTAHNLIAVNASIALAQLALGICLLTGRLLRPALLASVVWSLGVWYVGEGMGMLLTGQSSALLGSPGPVLLYALLGLAAYPVAPFGDEGWLPRRQLRLALSGVWALSAVLQLQPAWWHGQRISRLIAGNESPGTINGAMFDDSLRWFAHAASGHEVVLNCAVVVIAVTLATGLAFARGWLVRAALLSSVAVSLALWYAAEGCGMLLTGNATDVNSGPLLVLLALASWPVTRSHSEM